MKKKQREIFLKSEGDAFFLRNRNTIRSQKINYNNPIIKIIKKNINFKKNYKYNFLEIGCGEGQLLNWISENLNVNCYGIDPSKKAIKIANSKKVKALQGTAEKLRFSNQKFDFVFFGFCLYLCDRSDLFKIVAEANRVLKNNGLIIIYDFYSKIPIKKKYHHFKNIFSYKMDYRKIFLWHPNYSCIYQKKFSYSDKRKKIENQDFSSISVLKKRIYL